jgi:predicted alpha/beta superfamily hydrolase
MVSKTMYGLTMLAIATVLLSCEESDRRLSIDAFKSAYVDERQIDILLPPSYYHSEKKYPVLYMHDGQNIFDTTTSYGGVSWEVDSISDVLVANGLVEEFIVIGIWNNGMKRGCEYQPLKPFREDSSLMQKLNKSFRCEEIVSDRYLRFIVEELKPFVDQSLRTKKDVANTYISGSSMGGLISFYAITEYPEVFGGAACISTHWLSTTNYEESIDSTRFDKLVTYFENNLNSGNDSRIYFDFGTETLDSLYEPFQKRVDSLMIQKGFSATQWQTKKFPGHAHTESSWKERFNVPLMFLFGN